MKEKTRHKENSDAHAKLNDLIIKLKTQPISEIQLGELVKPGGYADTIVKVLNTTQVQVRKVYAEMKYIFERVEERGELDTDAEVRFYMLYPIIEYQKSRRVIDDNFAKLMQALLNNLEKFKTRENFAQAERFLTALVAYMKGGTSQ